jgi:PST family polysaccharide transporter
MSADLRSIISNVGWLFTQRIWQMGLSFFVSIFVARYLGSAQYGLLALSLSIVALFSFMSSLGLKNIVILDLVNQPTRVAEILGTSFLFKLLGGLFAYGCTLLSTWLFFSNTEESIILVAILGVNVVFNSFRSIELWNSAVVKSKFSAWSTIGGGFVSSAVKMALVFAQAPLYAFAIAALIEWIVEIILLLHFYRKQGMRLKDWTCNWLRGFRWLRESWYLILTGASASIYLKIDQVMLARMHSMEAVGQYAVAARFSEVLYFVPGAVVASVFPYLIKTREQQKSDFYARRMAQLYGMLGGVSLSIAILLSVAGPTLVPIIYGKNFAESGWILAIHTWASIPVFLGAGLSQWLSIERMFKFSLVCHASGAVANIALNFILIPKFGGYGASPR